MRLMRLYDLDKGSYLILNFNFQFLLLFLINSRLDLKKSIVKCIR